MQEILAALPDDEARWRARCEFDAVDQGRDVARTAVVGDAWNRGRR